jgi:ABC-type branched-subunit amino acid transport system ATPase component
MTGDVTNSFVFERIDYYYGGVKAVSGVSGTIGGGEIVGFIGPNGAGKSTLFSVLAGASRPRRGEISWRGAVITRRREVARARLGIIRVPQHSMCFAGLSVALNVAVGGHRLGRRSTDDVERLVRDLELWDLRDVAAGDLTFAEQRRLAIAVALAGRPDLLLLDEPGAGLDHDEKNFLAGVLRGLAEQGAAIGIIDHDLPWLFSVVSRAYVYDNGELLAQGTPEQLSADENVLRAYIGTPISAEELA